MLPLANGVQWCSVRDDLVLPVRATLIHNKKKVHCSWMRRLRLGRKQTKDVTFGGRHVAPSVCAMRRWRSPHAS